MLICIVTLYCIDYVSIGTNDVYPSVHICNAHNITLWRRPGEVLRGQPENVGGEGRPDGGAWESGQRASGWHQQQSHRLQHLSLLGSLEERHSFTQDTLKATTLSLDLNLRSTCHVHVRHLALLTLWWPGKHCFAILQTSGANMH